MNIVRGLLAVLAMSGAASAMQPALAADAQHHIAFLSQFTNNGANQAVFTGLKNTAAKIGGIDVQIFDGQGSPTVQYNQIEDVIAGHKFDGIVLSPNDPQGVAAVTKDAIDAGIKVAVVIFPIGPKMDTLEKQVPGLVTTVASDPVTVARAQADAVGKYCADKNPCNVVALIGFRDASFDVLRQQVYHEVLDKMSNVKIVATVEGKYDPTVSLAAIQDVLQSNPKIDAIIAPSDQNIIGAQLALDDAGIDPASVYLIGQGASRVGVKALRDGKWAATISMRLETMGNVAMQGLSDAFAGKTVPDYTDPSLIDGSLIVTKAVLDKHPEFVGEWDQ
jgi:ribose transport system substrate-binding protein